MFSLTIIAHIKGGGLRGRVTIYRLAFFSCAEIALRRPLKNLAYVSSSHLPKFSIIGCSGIASLFNMYFVADAELFSLNKTEYMMSLAVFESIVNKGEWVPTHLLYWPAQPFKDAEHLERHIKHQSNEDII